MEWKPNPGPQTKFLASPALEVLYGGAAGGGKSAALLIAPLRYVHLPQFHGGLFRRTYPELNSTLIPDSLKLYPQFCPGAMYNKAEHVWTFPSGARISFNHIADAGAQEKYKSVEYQYLGFDELTTFTREQYSLLFSRIRTSHNIPMAIRAGTNPGDRGHEWVFQRWGPWLDPEFDGPHAKPGEILYYLSGDDGTEQWVPRGTPGALSRQFIPAKVSDNPHVDQGYESRLLASGLGPVRLKQMREGNWLVKPRAGEFFKAEYFTMHPSSEVPEMVRTVRFWDRAATEKTRADWTVGVKYGVDADGEFWILDVARCRREPTGVVKLVRQTAISDGPNVEIFLEQEPGASGKFEVDAYVRALRGFAVRAVRPTGSKVSRANPVSATACAHHIHMVKAGWNRQFIDVLEAFPDGDHDDDVDALSGAHMAITAPRSQRRPPRDYRR